jgi:hypothetical protein
LTNAMNTQTVMAGTDAPTCESQLLASLGGTASDVAASLWNGWMAANDAFHATAAGAHRLVNNARTDDSCSAVTAEAHA